MCASFQDPRARDRELRDENIKKGEIFWLETFINALITQKPLDVQSRNLGAHECFMQTELGGAGHVTKILQAENRQKAIYLRNYRC